MEKINQVYDNVEISRRDPIQTVNMYFRYYSVQPSSNLTHNLAAIVVMLENRLTRLKINRSCFSEDVCIANMRKYNRRVASVPFGPERDNELLSIISDLEAEIKTL